MRLCLASAATAVLLAAGCGTDPAAPGVTAAPVTASAALSPSPSSSAVPSAGSRGASPGRSASPSRSTSRSPSTSTGTSTGTGRVSDGWEITVYYTAVEEFHDGDPIEVTGCRKLDCAHGDDALGRYPEDFVQAVQDEGTGRTDSGRYLNWSYDIGFWLDSQPRSSDGRRLVPFVSAAADPDVLAHGTRFTVAACGRQEDGSRPPAATCAAVRKASWLVTDEFTPGLGGRRHLDAYIGPETGPGFTDSDWYVSLTNARLLIEG
ncbi:hypothetical protein [Actinoplanes sp. M2I2]|uniref:hypothetical protein n=1 Tax=Actinoplanes sp. M2I2 TaxID=1734444 RepID=UPI0020227CEB|nr:hypothetical protein [Actinoplanes sp. M2I2]